MAKPYYWRVVHCGLVLHVGLCCKQLEWQQQTRTSSRQCRKIRKERLNRHNQHPGRHNQHPGRHNQHPGPKTIQDAVKHPPSLHGPCRLHQPGESNEKAFEKADQKEKSQKRQTNSPSTAQEN
jgi:hypothetical protein